VDGRVAAGVHVVAVVEHDHALDRDVVVVAAHEHAVGVRLHPHGRVVAVDDHRRRPGVQTDVAAVLDDDPRAVFAGVSPELPAGAPDDRALARGDPLDRAVVEERLGRGFRGVADRAVVRAPGPDPPSEQLVRVVTRPEFERVGRVVDRLDDV
jgi:hypothetical protein